MSESPNYCRQCEDLTEHRHIHETAHGLSGTHMAGTERFICNVCELVTYARDEGACHFIFVLDNTKQDS